MTSECSAEAQLALKKTKKKKRSNLEWTKYVHVTNTALHQQHTLKKL